MSTGRHIFNLADRDEPTVLRHNDYACKDTDTEIFFPEGRGSHLYDEAKAICRRCRHQAECLEWAIDTDQRWGLWGGLTPEQRNDIRKRRSGT